MSEFRKYTDNLAHEAFLKHQRAIHPDKMRQSGQRYREAHREKERERVRQYRKTCPEKVRETMRNHKRKALPTPTRPEPELCEICGGFSRTALHLDHCHKTNTFRGWLCGPCNMGIGLLRDDSTRLRIAIDYLERHEGTHKSAA